MSILDSMIEDIRSPKPQKLTFDRVNELRAFQMPHETANTWMKVKPDILEEDRIQAERDVAALSAYLNDFLPRGSHCPNCDREHGFSWGICHGEGTCRCGYPGRAMHCVKDADGDELLTLRDCVLWYHPDYVECRDRKPNPAARPQQGSLTCDTGS